MKTVVSPSRRKGFTLLEAILALAVFALGVVGLFQALNEIGLATVESAEKSAVTGQLRARLTEQLRNPRIRPVVVETGPDSHGIAYLTVVEEAPLRSGSGSSLFQMYAIRVEAFRRLPGGDRKFIDRAETLRYGPLYGP